MIVHSKQASDTINGCSRWLVGLIGGIERVVTSIPIAALVPLWIGGLVVWGLDAEVLAVRFIVEIVCGMAKNQAASAKLRF